MYLNPSCPLDLTESCYKGFLHVKASFLLVPFLCTTCPKILMNMLLDTQVWARVLIIVALSGTPVPASGSVALCKRRLFFMECDCKYYHLGNS